MEPYVGRVARRRAGVRERVLCRCRVPLRLERDRILSLHLMREALHLIREAIKRQLTTLTLALAACVRRQSRGN